MRSRSQKPTATDRAIEVTIGAEENTEMSKEAHVQGQGMAEYTITKYINLQEDVRNPAGALVHMLDLNHEQYKEQCTNDTTRAGIEKRIAIACGDVLTVKRAGKEDLSGKVNAMYPLRPDFDLQNQSFTSGAEADSKNNSDALRIFFF